MKRAAILTIALLLCANACAQLPSPDPKVEQVESFQIFDNLYYVGIRWVGAYLINTSEGLILIDSLYGDYVDHLLNGVRKAGFDPRDIKYVLVTHAHFDHLGGAHRIQQISGARVGMVKGDWDLQDAAEKAGRLRHPPVPRDLVIDDEQTITLGDTTITCYATPGHTQGVLSLKYTVHDDGAPHTAFTFGGASLINVSQEDIRNFVRSVERIQAMDGLEVNIPNHAFMGGVFERAKKLETRKPGDPHPFVDPQALDGWLESLVKGAKRRLE